MNKKTIVILSFLSFFSFLFLLSLTEAREPSANRFRYYMHEIFDGYVHSKNSFALKEYDVSDIHLKNMQEALIEAKKYMPQQNKDGTPIDRKVFLERVDQLQNTLLYLRTAVRGGDVEVSKRLGEEVFDMCVACHSEVKVPYLFRFPQRTTIFGEYMHKISDHADLARIYMEESVPGETELQFKLIGYYLGLLQDVFPEQGPSGVIMDREGFNNRLKETQAITKDLQKALREKGAVDIADYKKKINGLCVACHEPERLK